MEGIVPLSVSAHGPIAALIEPGLGLWPLLLLPSKGFQVPLFTGMQDLCGGNGGGDSGCGGCGDDAAVRSHRRASGGNDGLLVDGPDVLIRDYVCHAVPVHCGGRLRGGSGSGSGSGFLLVCEEGLADCDVLHPLRHAGAAVGSGGHGGGAAGRSGRLRGAWRWEGVVVAVAVMAVAVTMAVVDGRAGAGDGLAHTVGLASRDGACTRGPGFCGGGSGGSSSSGGGGGGSSGHGGRHCDSEVVRCGRRRKEGGEGG